MSIYARRRAEFAKAIGQDGIAIVPSARHATRNADTEYEYRQNSDFYYLTGFAEPEAVLVIAPKAEHTATLFLRPKDRTAEIWTGKRAGVEGALADFGMDAAHPIAEFEDRLPELLVGASTLHFGFTLDDRLDRVVLDSVAAARFKVRRGGKAPLTFVEPGTLLHEMRLRKGPEELAIMRRAAAASRAGHEAGMRATRPGLHEYELEAIIEYNYRMAGAQDVAYPSIVAGGTNATILHYNTNRDVLRDGDLVLVDSGAEVDLYASDVTRTWPVSGRFSSEQRAIYDIVLRAQQAGIEQVRSGRPYDAYHEAAVRVLTEGLIDVGLLQGSVEQAIADNAFFAFYPHRTGHWIGLDVHDVGGYKNADDAFRALEPGMVLTVEPGLYVQPDLDVPERWKGIGVRIEDDVLCTSGAPEVLTAAIPKTIEELEGIVGADAMAGVR
ncbi:MAG TPA: aminopeptidase P N-terminal domain-containing protein [Candidatus Baltobacteraceae bacterium]|nr:aminopeptidase P N-terminal domain-containing protein [Candidatus Baltobacteraceae bacterium]